jgi:branched-chain amino acid transport system substrate-binding protein
LDNSPDNPVTASTLQKFIERHHIQVLLTQSKASGFMASPVATKNNIIHFSLASDPGIADGKNNYLVWNEAHQQSKVLDKSIKPDFVAQYKETYKSHPVTEAGYAFDVFNIVNQSAVIALKSKPSAFGEKMSEEIQVLADGKGMMGIFQQDQKGILYAQNQTSKKLKEETA